MANIEGLLSGWASLSPMDGALLQISFEFNLSLAEIQRIYDDCQDLEATRNHAALVRGLLNSRPDRR